MGCAYKLDTSATPVACGTEARDFLEALRHDPEVERTAFRAGVAPVRATSSITCAIWRKLSGAVFGKNEPQIARIHMHSSDESCLWRRGTAMEPMKRSGSRGERVYAGSHLWDCRLKWSLVARVALLAVWGDVFPPVVDFWTGVAGHRGYAGWALNKRHDRCAFLPGCRAPVPVR